MASHPPNEFDNEEDPCSVCTLINCTGCLHQPEDDRIYVNGEVAALNRHVNASRKKLPPEFHPGVKKTMMKTMMKTTR